MRMSRMRGLCHSNTPWWQYDGTHETTTIAVDGTQRTLIKILGSGKLAVVGDLYADVWMCGCGAAGGDGQPGVKAGDGGGGAYALERGNVRLVTGPVTVATSPLLWSMYLDMQATGGSGKTGGSGGGGGGMAGSTQSAGGAGDGLGKVPFSLTAHFQPHCAGGGGGGYNGSGGAGGRGGAGGSNGTNGGGAAAASAAGGGSGGSYGAGQGGVGFTAGTTPSTAEYGANAAQDAYGSGGGGGGSGLNATGIARGGKGCQGVVYLLLHR